MARKHKLAAAVLAMGCLHTSTAIALGLGELELKSFLNEPLEAVVNLRNQEGLSEDQIRVRLATSEDFAKMGVERAYFLTTINFDVVVDDGGKARIVISTDEPVLEPYLDLIVEARWPNGRLLREYTVLIDPPVYAEAPVIISAAETVTAMQGAPLPTDAPAAKPTGLFGVDSAGSKKKFSGQVQESETGYPGTRVDIAESDLDAGTMPQRRFNASAAAAPMPGVRYMIGRDDTLWDIAKRARPAGVSVHQEMLDIQRLNPDAFINGNINRIKAGYIIYLPASGEISSTDIPAALAEVNRQNAVWREGGDGDPGGESRPSLRISTAPSEPVDKPPAEIAATSVNGDVQADTPSALEAVSAAEDTAVAVSIDADRLAAVEEQLATLKRIISLKNDQIAALQSALAAADVEAGELATGLELENLDAGVDGAADEQPLGAEMESLEEASADEVLPNVGEGELSQTEQTEQTALGLEALAAMEEAAKVAPEPEPEPEPAPEAKPAPKQAEIGKQPSEKPSPVESDGIRSLLYGAVALLLGLGAYAFVRRRKATAEERDVFTDVELKQQSFDVEVEASDLTDRAPVSEPEAAPDNRGYGEVKHDRYAADVDSSDALAEADIYIAYGRHPQAIDLLNSALNAEPDNPFFRLKLLEIYHDLNNAGGVATQLERIRESGDAVAIERADAIMAQATVAPDDVAAGVADEGKGVETDFTELQIEESSEPFTTGDELDLTADFDATEGIEGEEELVIADDSNGLSTKMDLARAYLDMGDDDGARQILDEIIAEGGDELKAEALTLLERIGR